MRADRRGLVWAMALSGVFMGGMAHAAPDAGPALEDGGVANDAGAEPAGGEEDDPHGGGAANADRVLEDARLPGGTVAIQILDGSGQAAAQLPVTLTVLKNTVAKGESKEERTGTTDEQGRLLFRDLVRGNGTSYRVSVAQNGAMFAAPVFALSPDKGSVVLLHVYPVTRETLPLEQLASIENVRGVKDRALIVVEGILYAELKDDRVQMQQLYRVLNAGSVAWLPDVMIPLPAEYTSFVNDTQPTSDATLDAVAGKGLRLRGTLAPGRHELTFRWQLPYAGEDHVAFELTPPPGTYQMRLIAAASEGMRLDGEGFPASQPQTDGKGSRVLITERSIRRGDPMLAKLRVTLSEIPATVPAAARLAALLLAAVGVGAGIAVGSRKRGVNLGQDAERRELLLADMEELVRAHRAGEVGPRTFERAKNDLRDAIARTFPVR